jgi:hypothetical protein
MSKKKKGKVVPIKPVLQSPEKYIKTTARSLPIFQCLINQNWQTSGIANIIVARKHKNGNVTFGIYLVDLYCLGLKDTFFKFNTDPDEYEELKPGQIDWEACEYTLAHNIIYGAVAFAEDYGFKPYKEFEVTQFILENDDDNVELVEVEFGYNGKPFYVTGPHDDAAKVKFIKNTLVRTAGEGNFDVLEGFAEDDDFGGNSSDEDWLSEEEQERYDAIIKIVNTLDDTDDLYDALIRTDEAREKRADSAIGKGYSLTEDTVENVYRKFDNTEQADEYFEWMTLVEEKKYGEAISGLLEVIERYPEKAPFFNLLQTAYLFNNQGDKSDEIIIDMYKRFPGYLFSIANYVNLLLQRDQIEEAGQVINGKADLDDIYPDRKLFNEHEAAIYYATMCRYFIALDDIDTADLYMDAIFDYELYFVEGQFLTSTVMLELGDAKMKK